MTLIFGWDPPLGTQSYECKNLNTPENIYKFAINIIITSSTLL